MRPRSSSKGRNTSASVTVTVTVCACMQALQTAELYDRIHLRTTNYNYAKYLESRGQIAEAIK